MSLARGSSPSCPTLDFLIILFGRDHLLSMLATLLLKSRCLYADNRSRCRALASQWTLNPSALSSLSSLLSLASESPPASALTPSPGDTDPTTVTNYTIAHPLPARLCHALSLQVQEEEGGAKANAGCTAGCMAAIVIKDVDVDDCNTSTTTATRCLAASSSN